MHTARRRAVTIKHVAAAAGVSLQTVSRVINDGPNVRDEIKARVREAIAKLGYVPSLAARRMGGSRSYLLLALNDRDRTIEDWRSGQGKDWIDQMLLGGMLKCAEHGYRMMFELVDTHGDQVEREIMGALSALHPDGVILTPPHSDNPLITALLTQQGIPFARIGSVKGGAGFGIAMDEAGAAAAATRHLAELGHHRVGFITGSGEYALSATRLEGHARVVREARLSSDPALIVPGDFSYESGRVAAEALLGLAEPPTAIVANSDQMALATLDVARARGLSMPADLSVISFDDTPVARFSTPPMTAITQPVAAMTARAAELLIAATAPAAANAVANGGKPAVDDRPSILPFVLTVRSSTAPPKH